MPNMDAQLTQTLYRITCPNSLVLGEYHLGMLSGTERGHISQHLVDCPHCTSELAQLQAFMLDTAHDLEYNLAERLKIWVAKKLLTIDREEAAGTSVWAVRGNEDGPLIYEAGECQLTLEIQDDPQKPGQKSVIGLVLGIDPTAWQVHLWQNDKLLDAVPVDTLGNFTLDNLSPGGYKLTVSGPAAEIHVPDLLV